MQNDDKVLKKKLKIIKDKCCTIIRDIKTKDIACFYYLPEHDLTKMRTDYVSFSFLTNEQLNTLLDAYLRSSEIKEYNVHTYIHRLQDTKISEYKNNIRFQIDTEEEPVHAYQQILRLLTHLKDVIM